MSHQPKPFSGDDGPEAVDHRDVELVPDNDRRVEILNRKSSFLALVEVVESGAWSTWWVVQGSSPIRDCPLS